MKRFFVSLLVLGLLICLSASFLVSASAEELQVAIGQKFEYNSQAATSDSQLAWRKQAGSPDGLWQYEMYSLEQKAYYELVFVYEKNSSGAYFAWMKNPGYTGVGYARVRDNGTNFHPAQLADVVKTFHCPSGGKIQFVTTVARDTEWTSESYGTPSSIAIYLDGELVYPTGGAEYELLTSTTPLTIKLDLEVKKNSRIRVHIGAVGDQGGDGVDMENTVIYKDINDLVTKAKRSGAYPNGERVVDTTESSSGTEKVPLTPLNVDVPSEPHRTSLVVYVAPVAALVVWIVVLGVSLVKRKA